MPNSQNSNVATPLAIEDIKKSGLDQAKLATRLAFFIAGFGLSCWAPMVPYAKASVGANNAQLGLILLCLGFGSVLGMPIAGILSNRIGSKPVIIAGSLGLIMALPVLAITPYASILGMALFLLGLSLGAVDVATNVHGTVVQRIAGQPLMSGFHGLYSIGGLTGASVITLLLSLGLDLITSALLASSVILVVILIAARNFLKRQCLSSTQKNKFKPHSSIFLLGILAFMIFMVEGAVLDWGAVLLTEVKHRPVSTAGAGYVIFALTMTIARLVGDGFVMRAGNRNTLLISAILTSLGIAIAAASQNMTLVLGGFGLAGFGAANIVPLLFSLAGSQTYMHGNQAIAITSTLGYLGVFAGPVIIGFLASLTDLTVAFGALAVLMIIAAGLSGAAARLSR